MKGFQKPAVMAAALCVAFASCETKTSDDYSRQTAEVENGASAFEEQAKKAEPSEADMMEGKIIHGIIAAGWAHVTVHGLTRPQTVTHPIHSKSPSARGWMLETTALLAGCPAARCRAP
ncbi:MAG: hypothetical protein HFJ04_13015 [Lachnospiraceae bacterium]|nr:hypothetical protein [Lachnospiraceae bacterium]